MMKLPESINILGVSYRVEPVQDRLEVAKDRDAADSLAAIRYARRAIRVYVGPDSAPLPATEVLDSLLHEVIHGIFEGEGTLAAAISDPPGEEAFVGTLARLLTDTLMRNELVTGGAVHV